MITMPTTRQVWRDPAKRPWWRRVLAIHDPVIVEVVDVPGYTYSAWIDGGPVDLFLPYGFRSDGASAPPLAWVLGYRPDGVLFLGSLWHDFYYRHGFFLAPSGERLFVGCGKCFADRLFADITARMAGVHAPGRIAQTVLALFGWPAWWGGKKYRDKCAANPDYVELHGDYGND